MERLGRYDVLEELPSGTTGRVFLVEHGAGPASERVVKIIDPVYTRDARFVATLRRERAAAVAFRHAGATPLLEVVVAGGYVRLVTELVDGVPLTALMSRLSVAGARLPWRSAVEIGVHVGRALRAAHETNGLCDGRGPLLHGRVSPSAIYVTYDGQPRILGLGLGRARLCLPMSIEGVAYLPPELCRTSERSEEYAPSIAGDVYGLGLSLLDGLRARRTFGRDTFAATRRAVLDGDLERYTAQMSGVPQRLREVLMAMTERRPENRPYDLAEVCRELEAFGPSFEPSDAPRLADVVRTCFTDRAHLDRRARARLRRRPVTMAPRAAPAAEYPSAEDASALLRGPRPARAEPRRLAARPAPARVAATRASSLEMLERAELSDADLDSIVDRIVLSRAERGRGGPYAPTPTGPVTPRPRVEAVSTEAPSGPPPRPPAAQRNVGYGLEPGALVADRYRVLDVLGFGGAAVVYRVEHVLLGRQLALKLLRPELSGHPALQERFRVEAQSVSRLDHPNIVRVSDFGQAEGGASFYIMDLVPGDSLRNLLHRRGPLPAVCCIRMAQGVLAGLDYAHRAGLVHRDLKPENLMVQIAAGRIHAKILDFGIAKLVGERRAHRLTEQGVIPGTPAYMAPEQAAGDPIDARVDVYGLGITLYEALTGRCVFDGDTLVEVLSRVLREDPPPLGLPPSDEVDVGRLEEAVMHAIAKEPGQRHPNARAFSAALRACVRSA